MSSARLTRAKRFDGRCVGSLTKREREISELVVLGVSNGNIQEWLGITYDTLHAHHRSIYAKLGVENLVQMATATTRMKFEGRPKGPLTGVEREFATLISLGETNRQIQAQLKMTRWAINDNLKRICAKLGVDNRVQLAVAVTKRKFLMKEKEITCPHTLQ